MEVEVFSLQKKIIFLLGILLLFLMIGCANDISPANVMIPDDETIPVGIDGGKNISGKEAEQKEYTGWVGAYLEALKGNNIESVAILDVFGDETPELLYIYYSYIVEQHDTLGELKILFYALKIFSYSEPGGTESVFDTIIFVAVGGGHNYCVYITREGELMLYLYIGGGPYSWGFWQVKPNQNLEFSDYYSISNYNSDLAELYFLGPYGEDRPIYKKNGEEISQEKFDKVAKEMMENIEYVIFPGLGDAELYDKGLWKDVVPFEERSMTYEEALAWLEKQGKGK